MDSDDATAIRQRRLDLQGAVNFRDLGGYDVGGGRQTRWRRLWRADSLSALTAADQAQVAALGLHTLIDFRLPMERAHRPNALPAGSGITIVELGFLPEGTQAMLQAVKAGRLNAAGVERAVLAHYRRFPLAHHREYAAMFDHVERAAGAPVLIHCTSGKDRTGYGAALLLLALGAPAETIAADYALTNRYRRDVSFLFSDRTPPDVADMLTSAQPHYIAAALEAMVEHHGSADAYLDRALGVTPARRERLRALLTEQAADHAGGNWPAR